MWKLEKMLLNTMENMDGLVKHWITPASPEVMLGFLFSQFGLSQDFAVEIFSAPGRFHHFFMPTFKNILILNELARG